MSKHATTTTTTTIEGARKALSRLVFKKEQADLEVDLAGGHYLAFLNDSKKASTALAEAVLLDQHRTAEVWFRAWKEARIQVEETENRLWQARVEADEAAAVLLEYRESLLDEFLHWEILPVLEELGL